MAGVITFMRLHAPALRGRAHRLRKGCFYGTPLRHTAGRIFLRAGKKFYYSISILCEGSCLGWLLGTVSVSIPLSYFAFTFSLSISSPT